MNTHTITHNKFRHFQITYSCTQFIENWDAKFKADLQLILFENPANTIYSTVWLGEAHSARDYQPIIIMLNKAVVFLLVFFGELTLNSFANGDVANGAIGYENLEHRLDQLHHGYSWIAFEF